jgi:hypothetical protein
MRNENKQQQTIIKECHNQSLTLTIDELLLKNSDNFGKRDIDIKLIADSQNPLLKVGSMAYSI